MNIQGSGAAAAAATHTRISSVPSQSSALTADNYSETAGRVAGLMQSGRQGEAVALLNGATDGQPQAVQDAMYRMVSSKLGASISPEPFMLEQAQYATPVEVGNTIRQINEAGSNPPSMPNTDGLSDQQKFMVYASIVEVRGNQSAKDALADSESVILGLRSENDTMVNNGKGLYDDRLAVIAKEGDGTVHVKEFTRVSTEPTAQYDGNQKNHTDLGRFRRAEGEDVTNDGVPELGRLSEGTTEMIKASHPNPSSAGGTKWALRPSSDAVTNGANRVERDSNHDLKFDSSDTNGVTDLNNTFKIHAGSRNNTDSAGCTTIHGDDYKDFKDAATRDANQDTWQYVLTKVEP
ncbi:hypothetical protein BTA51_03795 [Hahella sp. CCB-MM4]|uniref:hypothetical protein n=1 Tax=Hahella sp. (strain CCB-MM4) TaxID=1926491 RepID=UPI000B9BB4D0|nr:hypothetical protein [Hahella sp. CCB-MM4]OZG74154.1 hypothetical protein BTA51_03795 [Hahella sp. CCB-MM4]